MLNKKFIRNNIIAFAVLGIVCGIMWLPMVGLAALLLSGIDFLVGRGCLITGQKNNGLTLLLCSGILLLIGFSICSTVALDFK